LHVKIGINGIGIAGPALAYWLQRFGHEPVLFEKAPAQRQGGYVIDFWGLGYDLAERMGILPALLERGYFMRELRMVDENGKVAAALDVSGFRKYVGDRFVSVERSVLSALLFEACSGVRAHFGVSIAKIAPDAEGVTARLSNGDDERFDLVVGADGLHSHVRELAFPGVRAERFVGCYVAAVRLPHYPHRDELVYVSHTAPKRHVSRVALHGGETLLLFIWRSNDADLANGRAAKALIRDAFGGLGWEVPDMLERLDTVEDVYLDRVSQIRMERWTTAHAAVVGDAAACASLLAGEGTGLAMIEAYVLAGELQQSNGDIAAALGAYEAKLRRFVLAKQDAALGFRGFFAPNTSVGLWARNVAVNAASIPFVAKHLLARSLRDDLQLPKYESS
jgi:2-polyprenyl-6-methoxyphenol hydroxylase-like FAD-dependent oxidoreductase